LLGSGRDDYHIRWTNFRGADHGLIDNVRIYNRALSVSEINSDMNTPISLRPMRLAPSVAAPTGEAAPLTAEDLGPGVEQAIGLWPATGLGADRAEMLRGATIQVSVMPAPYLGLTSGKQIWISANAAGLGWSVDPSPATGLAPGRVDLLTVVAHEL